MHIIVQARINPDSQRERLSIRIRVAQQVCSDCRDAGLIWNQSASCPRDGHTFLVGFAEHLWRAGAAVRLRVGHATCVSGIIAGRTQGGSLVRVVCVRGVSLVDLVPALAGPPHVVCISIHSNSVQR